MNEENKSTVNEQSFGKKRTNKPISSAEKLAIFEDYLEEGLLVYQLSAKYSRGVSTISEIISTFEAELASRPEASRPEASAADAADANPTSDKDIFMGKERELKLAQQVKALQAQLKQQEKQLKQEQLGHLFYKKMVDIAERDLHLEIRKKYGAKQ